MTKSKKFKGWPTDEKVFVQLHSHRVQPAWDGGLDMKTRTQEIRVGRYEIHHGMDQDSTLRALVARTEYLMSLLGGEDQ